MSDGAIAPISPATGQPTPVATTDPAAAPVTPQAPAGDPNAPPPPEVPQVRAVDVRQETSPIRAQRRDSRGNEPDYDPLQITFLAGAYKGKAIDLGLGVAEISTSQDVAWESRDADGVRVGANFKNIGGREFSFSLDFYDLGEDVIHLTENLAHMGELTGDEKQPPALLLTWGSKTIGPVVMTRLGTAFDHPHSEQRGFKHARVDLAFMLYGGAESEHALGKPLVATPLGDDRAAQTDAERQQQGQQAVNQLLLAECLGEEGADRLAEMIQNGSLADPEALADLDANAYVQAVTAGIIPATALADQAERDRLAANLAAVMARNENGVGTSINAQAFADALVSGDVAALPADLQEQALASREDYGQILEAMAAGNLEPVLEPGQAAGEKLRNFGSCGLTLRQVGGLENLATPVDDAATLAGINEFLQGASSEEIQARFGVDAETAGRLQNGQPYQSKDEFIQFTADAADGSVSGYALWASFGANAVVEEPVDVPAEEST